MTCVFLDTAENIGRKIIGNFFLCLYYIIYLLRNLLNSFHKIRFKVCSVLLSLILVTVYTNFILDFNGVINAADFDYDGMVHGTIVYPDYDEINEIVIHTEEPASFMTESELILSNLDPDSWFLVLVNKNHPIKEDCNYELAGYRGYEVDSRIYDSLVSMFEDAKLEGINLTMASGFRTNSVQTGLYHEKINQFRNAGYTEEEAIEIASMKVTPPGTSEHQTGLAVDILSASHTSMDFDFGNTKAGIWLRDNSYKYGFILRYPEGKEEITDIQYEPWHFRYVGTDAASYIYESNLTYEEFYDLLLKVKEYER